MAYLYIDDGFCDHPSIRGLSDAAFRLHVAGMNRCARYLTDGVLLADDVPDLVRRYKRAALDELIEKGRWAPMGTTAYEIVGYLDHNDSREVVEERRRRKAERQAKWLAKAQAAKGKAT
jgi:hypothetical protein